MVKTNKKTNQDDVPNLEESNVESGEQITQNSRYVVVRGGLRVSDREYTTNADPIALNEKLFWQKVVKRWPDGTKVEIVAFDKKKHRVW